MLARLGSRGGQKTRDTGFIREGTAVSIGLQYHVSELQ